MFAFRTTTHSQNDPKYLWKFIVRGLAVLFALIAIVIIGADNRKDPMADMDTDHLVLVGGIIPLAFSLMWNLINIIVLLIQHRSITPGAIVGCDLILWVGLATGTILLLIFDFMYGGPSSNQVPEVFVCVFVSLALLCHFVLFVAGCKDTHELRRDRRMRRPTQLSDEENMQLTRQKV